MKRFVPFVLFSSFVIVIFFFALSLWSTPDHVKSVNKKTPITKMVDQKGVLLDFDKLKGPIILHFAAAWCHACQDEMPRLVALAAASNIPLWLVVYDSKPQDLKDSASADHIVVDRGGTLSLHWGIRALPASFIVGAGGKIAASIYGAMSASDFKKAVGYASND